MQTNCFDTLRNDAERNLSEISYRRYLIEEKKVRAKGDDQAAWDILAGYVRSWVKKSADLSRQNARRLAKDPYHKRWEKQYNQA